MLFLALLRQLQANLLPEEAGGERNPMCRWRAPGSLPSLSPSSHAVCPLNFWFPRCKQIHCYTYLTGLSWALNGNKVLQGGHALYSICCRQCTQEELVCPDTEWGRTETRALMARVRGPPYDWGSLGRRIQPQEWAWVSKYFQPRAPNLSFSLLKVLLHYSYPKSTPFSKRDNYSLLGMNHFTSFLIDFLLLQKWGSPIVLWLFHSLSNIPYMFFHV